MPTVREAFTKFLELEQPTHNGPDLLARFLSEPIADLEMQVNVSSAGGERMEGKNNTYTNGTYEWWNVRWPKKADSGGEWRDYELKWPPELHASDIGVTGWNWANKESVAVGFDFDAITGHAAGVGVSDEELERVKAAAQAIPWVEVRRSTSGKGLHLWVFLEQGIKTENHTVHAALARAILGLMSAEANFDFASQIDACGSVLWIWSRRATPENQGFAQIKAATELLGLSKLPLNWRDHVAVVTRRRDKVRVQGVGDDVLDPFEALTSARRKVPLDAKHKAIIEALIRTGYTTCWVGDHHLLQTKTTAFKLLMNDTEVKKELGLIGFFDTLSEGKNFGKPNCFAFPVENGGWRVFRFPGPGVPEHPTWTQDGEGWTTCDFNCRPNLATAATVMGGAEMPDNKGFQFTKAADAVKAVEALGGKPELENKFLDREAHLKKNRDGRLVMRLKHLENEQSPGQRWVDKKGWWEKVFGVKTEEKKVELSGDYDAVIRATVSPTGERAGWLIKAKANEWDAVPKGDAKNVLLHLGKSKDEADAIIGGIIMHRWKLVNLPFQSEYPGGRQWNLNAPQFRYLPSDDEEATHPHWDRILAHCGRQLDEPLRTLDWAKQANVRTGGDYLLAWIACMLRDPFCRLPYLFLFGEQNSGKSMLHEAIALLMTKGTHRVDDAIMGEFNAPLANCILATIEEKDIAKVKGAYDKIKDWVTSLFIPIRKMRTDTYMQPNMLHFVQCGQSPERCPIFPGDTRITMMFVQDLPVNSEIPKRVLISRLEQEAPAFMRTVMNFVLPPEDSALSRAAGRLRLPVVRTSSKDRAEEQNVNPLEPFLAEHCHKAPGELIAFDEFVDKFHLSPLCEDKSAWSKKRIQSLLPNSVVYGAYTNNKRYLANLAWERPNQSSDKKPFVHVLSGGRLVLRKEQ